MEAIVLKTVDYIENRRRGFFIASSVQVPICRDMGAEVIAAGWLRATS